MFVSDVHAWACMYGPWELRPGFDFPVHGSAGSANTYGRCCYISLASYVCSTKIVCQSSMATNIITKLVARRQLTILASFFPLFSSYIYKLCNDLASIEYV
jgi:hypothetical protein